MLQKILWIKLVNLIYFRPVKNIGAAAHNLAEIYI